ncbi:uncharacterized protein PG998_009901 [Apiospora kogelbergensis]|uniref:uncharacterized protein n=1 Tax=Apiospora kogelbergensis TaxID=1337665 RepID=UPI00312E73F5
MPRPGYDTTSTNKTASYTNMNSPILRNRPPPDEIPARVTIGRMNIFTEERQRSRDGARDHDAPSEPRATGSRRSQ